MPGSADFLRDLAVVLATAAATSVACQRLRLPVVVGYVAAGILVGPYLTPQLVTDIGAIQTLSELGIVLLLFSVGMEFSLRRLGRLLPVVGPAAAVEVGLVFALGYLVAHLLGWSPLERLFTGAVVSISSTMVVAKLYEEQPPPRRLADLVFGVLIMEDLVAILLLVFLTAQATGAMEDGNLLTTAARLLGFLALVIGGGMLLVPRGMRAVVRLQRNETILVAAVGVAFFFAELAALAGYSVALGAFVAGALVKESGVARQVGQLLVPVRDMFGAIFFVAVGMQADLLAALAAWPAVLLLVAVVLVGKTVGNSLGGFLAGFGVRTSVQGGMTLSQTGEFGFVIAGLGLSAGVVGPSLYPVAVMVSLITILLTPMMMRLADPIATRVDRRLPKPVQTFVTLYDSWIELTRRRSGDAAAREAVRSPIRWMVLDAMVIAAIIAATTAFRPRMIPLLERFAPPWPEILLLAGSGALALPFVVGLVTSARRLALHLAATAMPLAARGVDQANAPRRLLVATLQIGIVLVLGLPLIAITQPFLTAWPLALVVASLLLLLVVGFWRSAANLEGHVRAGAELIVDVIARQGVDKDARALVTMRELLPGLGHIVPVTLDATSPAVGRTLGGLNLRGLTGATVVALVRDGERTVYPTAAETLHAGDVLALTGSEKSLEAAQALLGAAVSVGGLDPAGA